MPSQPDFEKNWSFAAPITAVVSARGELESVLPDNPSELQKACVDACMALISKLGEGPFSAAISGKGNKVYISLQEVSKNAVL
jgi:hypothetical protein